MIHETYSVKGLKWRSEPRSGGSPTAGDGIHGTSEWHTNRMVKIEAHRFYLGTDLIEAKLRNDPLEDLWKCIERDHVQFGWDLEWNDLTFMIGREIAKGDYRIVVSRKNNHLDAYTRYINRLQSSFPMVSFVPEIDEAESYEQGAQQARFLAMSSVKRRTAKFRASVRDKLIRGGGLAASEVMHGEEMLHEAFDAYFEEIKSIEIVPGTETVTDSGNAKKRILPPCSLRSGRIVERVDVLCLFRTVELLILGGE